MNVLQILKGVKEFVSDSANRSLGKLCIGTVSFPAETYNMVQVPVERSSGWYFKEIALKYLHSNDRVVISFLMYKV